jgi:general secretion pathway protein L
MEFFAPLLPYLDSLVGLVERLREDWRGRRALVVVRDCEKWSLRAGVAADAPILASIVEGSRLPDDICLRARAGLVLLEWPRERTVERAISAPTQALEFLQGVVRNQIDRLSPWSAAQIAYGYSSIPAAGALEVRVRIAARSEIERVIASLGASGLVVDRVVAAGGEGVSIWTRAERRADADRRRLRGVVGGAIGAPVAICAAVAMWATSEASSLHAQSEEFDLRAKTLQRRAQGGRGAQPVGATAAERAWSAKETQVSALCLLEALSHALPDSAYLTELQIEEGKLRIGGLAEDAPPLIGALESSGQLGEVRFSTPTTRGPDGRSFRFGIEAQIAPRLALEGG